MSIFESISKVLDFLNPERVYREKEDDELDVIRESFRKDAIMGDEKAKCHMDIIDSILRQRRDEEYRKQHPEPTEARHTEHGWYLPEDDD